MKCKECGKDIGIKPGKSRCRECRRMIMRERAERIAELPWYIFDRDDSAMAGSNPHPQRPVEATFHINMSKRKFTI